MISSKRAQSLSVRGRAASVPPAFFELLRIPQLYDCVPCRFEFRLARKGRQEFGQIPLVHLKFSPYKFRRSYRCRHISVDTRPVQGTAVRVSSAFFSESYCPTTDVFAF
jgi:hypothetical protein